MNRKTLYVFSVANFKYYQRAVVAVFIGGALESGDSIFEFLNNIFGGEMPMLTDNLIETGFAEEFTLAVHGFGKSVGVNNEKIVRQEDDKFLLVGCVPEKSYRHTASFQGNNPIPAK